MDISTQKGLKPSASYKVIALDVDGTLVNSSGIITQKTKEALIATHDRLNIKLVVASGRPLAGLRAIADTLELAQIGGYLLAYNGGVTYDCGAQKILDSRTLPIEIIPQLYDLVKEAGLNILTYSGDFILSEDIANPYLQKEVAYTQMKSVQISGFVAEIPKEIPKCLVVGSPEQIVLMQELVRERLGAYVDAFRSDPTFLEVVPKGINKAQSLRSLLSHLGATPQELIAFGDSYNDIEMLELAGLGVAMANGKDEVKRIADLITLDNNSDGIAHALEYCLSTSENE